MADTRPTAVSFLRAIKLCLFAMFAPTKLDVEERLDNEARAHFSSNDPERSKAKLVTSAFWSALCLVLFFGGVGYICSLVLPSTAVLRMVDYGGRAPDAGRSPSFVGYTLHPRMGYPDFRGGNAHRAC
jgi:hypothetical protein